MSSIIEHHFWIATAALLLDVLFGDPRYPFHPIRLIGTLVTRGEHIARRLLPRHEFIAGALLTITVVVFTSVVVWLLISLAYLFGAFLTSVVEVILLYTAFSLGALVSEGRTIEQFLKNGNVTEARSSLSWIVSRDVSKENERGIIRGVLETLTENLSDGVIAPLFYAIIGGVPFAFAYKAVNTLDSMIGYKTEEYFWFGKFAARLDDCLNYIPARLTGLLLVIVAYILHGNPARAIRAWRNDAGKGESPNGGIPIVAFAGARDITLGGDCRSKDGSIIHIPEVGGRRKKLELSDISSVVQYLHSATLLFMIVWFVAIVFF